MKKINIIKNISYFSLCFVLSICTILLFASNAYAHPDHPDLKINIDDLCKENRSIEQYTFSVNQINNKYLWIRNSFLASNRASILNRKESYSTCSQIVILSYFVCTLYDEAKKENDKYIVNRIKKFFLIPKKLGNNHFLEKGNIPLF